MLSRQNLKIFVYWAIGGAGSELVLGTDSHLENTIESMLAGTYIKFLLDKYVAEIPIVKKLWRTDYFDGTEIIAEMPYSTLGYMTGQTLVNLLK